MKLELKINNANEENAIQNLAFIRALLIKKAIENLRISYKEKQEIKQEILQYLKKGDKN